MLQWVKLNKYYELSGETRNTVYKKRRNGLWLEGREYRIADDGVMWVNLEAVNSWAEGRRGRRRK